MSQREPPTDGGVRFVCSCLCAASVRVCMRARDRARARAAATSDPARPGPIFRQVGHRLGACRAGDALATSVRPPSLPPSLNPPPLFSLSPLPRSVPLKCSPSPPFSSPLSPKAQGCGWVGGMTGVRRRGGRGAWGFATCSPTPPSPSAPPASSSSAPPSAPSRPPSPAPADGARRSNVCSNVWSKM